MEGILAVGGFWIFMIALVLKKPLSTLIEKSKLSPDALELTDRVQRLEALVSKMSMEQNQMHSEIAGLREEAEFSMKLIAGAKAETENGGAKAVGAGRVPAAASKSSI